MKKILAAMLMFAGLTAACSNLNLDTDTAARDSPDPDQIAAGRQIAMLRCASCHALDNLSRSPLPAAPPMARMHELYDAEMLANDLIDGIRVGHDEMPEFVLQVAEADALAAYLRSLR